MALPYAPDSYYRPPQNRISELLMRSGEIAARRAEQSGQIWSNAAKQIGGAVASGIQDYQEEKAAKKAAERDAYQAELLSAEFSKPDGPDWKRVYSTVGPERAMKIKAGYGTLQTQAIENEAHLSDLVQKKAAAIIALPEPMRPAAYTTAAQNLARLGVPADQMPPEYDEGFVRSLLPAQKQPEGFSLSPGQRRFDASGKEIAAAPEIAKQSGTHVVGGNLVNDEGKVLFTAPKDPQTGRAGDIKETANGFVVIDPVTGTAKPVTMGGERVSGPKALKSTKPSTGVEKKAVNFFNRMQEAEQTAAALEESGSISPTRDVATEGAPVIGKLLGAVANSGANKSYRQAQRAFTEARLRKESGAAVPQAEYDNDARTYFAQPGDSAELIAQKAASRRVVMAGIANEAGTAFDEFFGEDAQAQRDRLKGVKTDAGSIEAAKKKLGVSY